MYRTPMYTQTSTQIAEARRLVMQIRDNLEPFDYEPAPAQDNKERIKRAMITLDNGA